MAEVMRAVALLHGGDPVSAREALLELWDRLGPSDHPLQRCTVAHFLADTEEEPERELAWDLWALKAATGGAHDGDHEPGIPELAAFLPSLHLNAGEGYRRLGRATSARLHAEMGLRWADKLANDEYGGTIKAGLRRLQSRLVK